MFRRETADTDTDRESSEQRAHGQLRKHGTPAGVYEFSARQGSRFFEHLGRISFFGLAILLVVATIFWVLHRPGPADSIAPNTIESPEPAEKLPEATAGAADIVGPGPGVGYVAVWGISTTGASISWSTKVHSTSAVAYGTTPELGQITPVNSELTNSHGVQLTGLQPATVYYYSAQSVDADGVVGKSPVYYFTTKKSNPELTFSAIKVIPEPNNKVKISWTTSVPSYSYVELGSSTAYDRYSTRTELTTDAQPRIDWIPSGLIHYHLVSTDAGGKKVVSPDYTFVEP